MVRTAKSATPASTTPAAPKVEAAAPKAPRVKKAASAAQPKADAPVVAAPVEAASAAPAADVSSLPLKMTEYSAKLQQLVGLFSTLKNDFKTLEKAVSREMKAAAKASSKKRRNNGNRKPSGFIKPTRISDELAQFLGKTVGTEMARTDVSKEINAYIREKGLQDKENGRIIHPDSGLSKLLAIGSIPNAQDAVLTTSHHLNRRCGAYGGLHKFGELRNRPDLHPLICDDPNLVVAGGGEQFLAVPNVLNGGHLLGPSFDFLPPFPAAHFPDENNAVTTRCR